MISVSHRVRKVTPPAASSRRTSRWLYSSPFCMPQTVPESSENGWCPPSTSTMLNRRTPKATPGDWKVPRSFGPRWVMTSVMRSSASGDMTSRGSPGPVWTTPQIPHTRPEAIRRAGFRRPPMAQTGRLLERLGTAERRHECPHVPLARVSFPTDYRVRKAAECDARPMRTGRPPAEMLLRVADAAPRENWKQFGPVGRAAAAAEVDGDGARLVADRKPGIPGAAAQILVLAVHEEALVKPFG